MGANLQHRPSNHEGLLPFSPQGSSATKTWISTNSFSLCKPSFLSASGIPSGVPQRCFSYQEKAGSRDHGTTPECRAEKIPYWL